YWATLGASAPTGALRDDPVALAKPPRPDPLVPRSEGRIVSDDPTKTDEGVLDALDQADVLEADAVGEVEDAERIAEAAEEAEAEAIAAGDPEAAVQIDERADELITELVVEASEETEFAERIAADAGAIDADTALDDALPDEDAVEDEEFVVVPDVGATTASEAEVQAESVE